MKKISILHPVIIFVCFISISLFCQAVYGDDAMEAWQKKVDELQQKAENTTDIGELMKIVKELQDLMQQMPSSSVDLSSSSFTRGSSPEEEVERQIEAINRNYRNVISGLPKMRPQKGILIPVSLARKLKGFIKVTGKDSDSPRNGWIPLKLQYTIREDFAGHLVITRYYDPNKKEFTAKREYMISTISTKISVLSLSGKQCVETVGAPFGQCSEWRSLGTYDINEGDVYPAIHDWVILGSTDGDNVSIEIETPSLYFRSGDRKAGRGIGCFGAKIEKSILWLEEAIDTRSIKWKDHVGDTSIVTPRCEIGSNIEMGIDLCSPEDFADVDKCMQLEMLMEDVRLFLRIREAFKDMVEGASSDKHLNDLVTLEIRSEYPGMDLTDEKHLDKFAGGLDLCSSAINIPDLCQGCRPRPLCRWEEEALEIHEYTHQSDAADDPNLKKLFCRPELYANANWVDKEQAKALARLEYHAYTEQARYLIDIIEAQLSGNIACQFSPSFYVNLQEALHDLKTGTFD